MRELSWSVVSKRPANLQEGCGLCLLSVCAANACTCYSTVGYGTDKCVHGVHVRASCVRACMCVRVCACVKMADC